jgi:hypothetical protein
MKKCWLVPSLLLLAGAGCGRLSAQEAQAGIAMPLEITVGALDTGRAQAYAPSAAPFTAGFHLLAEPELKLGSHWYVYSAVQVRSTPFFYQDAFSPDRQIKTDLLQGFVGYTRSWNKTTLSFKAGKLASAFGSFPLQYSDAANALLDQPLPYNYLVPAGHAESYGLMPVTLYGLPGAEIDLSWRRVDARFQLTNSSPYNPLSLWASGQHPQWTAGGGYTIVQGFRVGMSAYRGPWLNDALDDSYPQGYSATDFPATALGADVQWARGYWSASGEWDRFVFDYPNFTVAPTLSFGYVEMKRIISPRWYAALRTGYQLNNYPVYWSVRSASTFLPNRQAYEVAFGYRPNRLMLLKAGYEVMNVHGVPPGQDNVFGVQFITSINSLSKAFK